MKIDRHNYEEYFLLYVDNELTIDQKKQVELFIKENPDLEEELVMLQQSRLIADGSIVFEKKHLLMREENDSFINMNNYEEWLVLYVDNELSQEQKATVEKFAATHQHVQAELDLFEQTKLQPDHLNFPERNLLYKNKDRVGVISMAWWRAAVAAILIIAAGITIYSVLNKKNNGGVGLTEENVAASKKEQTPNSVKSLSIDQQKQDNPVIKREEEQVAIFTPVRKPKQKENKKQSPDNLRLSDNQQAVINKRPVIVNEINDVKSKDPQMSSFTVTGGYKQIINDKDVTPEAPETPNQPEYASDTDRRLRGLFRKATRFIERTSGINPANDDNRVLIGGMAINLK